MVTIVVKRLVGSLFIFRISLIFGTNMRSSMLMQTKNTSAVLVK